MEDKKIDPAEMQIAASKILADGEAYFKLFEKHVPRDLGAGADVMLYKIGNMTCMLELIALNPAASYVIVGNEAASNALKVMLSEATKVKYLMEFDFKETGMKFDCIIMNPPYGRSLSHNILNIASKYLKDDKSVVVSLQPVTPYQTFVESTKVTKENMSHIKDIEIIQADKASEIFGITVRSDLGIIQIDNSIHDYKYQFNECKPIYDKIINKKLKSWRSVCVYDKDPKHFLYMNGDNGYAKGWHLKPTEIFNGKTNAKLVFNSKEEKDNFFNSVKNTWLYKFIYILDNDAAVPAHFPFMQDYSKPWDDARLYKYFNLTDEEIKTIEFTIEKFNKTKRQNDKQVLY